MSSGKHTVINWNHRTSLFVNGWFFYIVWKWLPLMLLIVQLASIADRTILEADKDEDGKISFEEFGKIMAKVDIEQRMSIRFLS